MHTGFYNDVGMVMRQPIVEPNLITGVGHGKCRPFDKMESNHKHKKKTARKMAKASRRRNRRS